MPRYESSSSAVRLIPDLAAPELDWELLYDVHAARLRRVIQRKVAAALVEDVLQETFLRAFQSRHSIDHSRPIAPWLITIALRTAADARRNQLRSVESVAIDGDDSPELALDALEEELLNRARRIGIKHAFASLNTRQRRLLELVAVDGMTYESAAASEDMTTDAVKSVLARARTNFRTSFTAATGEPGVFGAAGVGGWLLKRFRLRTHRSALFIGHHAAGFGAATLSVAIVAVGAVPFARPIPTEAREERAAVAAGTLVGASGLSLSPSSPPNRTAPAAPAAEVPSSGSARDLRVGLAGVETSVGVSRNHNKLTAQSTQRSETPVDNSRSLLGVEVFCDGGASSTITCSIADALPTLP
jgi:RNA polymerase sigma-70 factor (ECF subfamily)